MATRRNLVYLVPSRISLYLVALRGREGSILSDCTSTSTSNLPLEFRMRLLVDKKNRIFQENYWRVFLEVQQPYVKRVIFYMNPVVYQNDFIFYKEISTGFLAFMYCKTQ